MGWDVADVSDKVGEPAGCDVAQCGGDGEIPAADTTSLGAAVSANTEGGDVVGVGDTNRRGMVGVGGTNSLDMVGVGGTRSVGADREVAVVDLVADGESGRTIAMLNAHFI